jgi:hypothetical protein
MPRWTTSPQEYNEAREALLDATEHAGRHVQVIVKGSTVHHGFLAGINSGTDVAENLDAGRGPMITKMYADIQLHVGTGQIILLAAQDILAIDPTGD